MPPSPRIGTAAITENMLKRKWSATVLRYLEKNLADPSEILKCEPTLSPNALNERLRTMVRYQLVARFPRPPPSLVIEYRLTQFGKKILEMLNAIDQLDAQLASQGRTSKEEVVPEPPSKTKDSNTPESLPPFRSAGSPSTPLSVFSSIKTHRSLP